MRIDWHRLSIRVTRISGVTAGLTFLLAAGLIFGRSGVLHWDLLLTGIAFPVALWWMARVMERSRPQ